MNRRDLLKSMMAVPLVPVISLTKPLNTGLQYTYGRIEVTGYALRSPRFPQQLGVEIRACARGWEKSLMACYKRLWEPTVPAHANYEIGKWPTPIIYPGRDPKKHGWITAPPVVLPGTIGVVGELPKECYKVSAYAVAADIMDHNGDIWHRKENHDAYTVTFFLYLNVVKGLHSHTILPAHIPAWLDSQTERILESAPTTR